MNTYLIDPRANGGDQFTVEANDIGEAAQIAARRIHPKIASQFGRWYFAQRETGDPEGSGLFKTWKHMRGDVGLQSDYGGPFHVMER
jgi:hypothetical protein